MSSSDPASSAHFGGISWPQRSDTLALHLSVGAELLLLKVDRGGNNLAVYAFDERSGRAELLQHVATESVHVRTFSLDVGSRLLVAASILPAALRRDGMLEPVPARLSFFRVADDGRLALARIHDMLNDRPRQMFWSRLNGRL